MKWQRSTGFCLWNAGINGVLNQDKSISTPLSLQSWELLRPTKLSTIKQLETKTWSISFPGSSHCPDFPSPYPSFQPYSSTVLLKLHLHLILDSYLQYLWNQKILKSMNFNLNFEESPPGYPPTPMYDSPGLCTLHLPLAHSLIHQMWTLREPLPNTLLWPFQGLKYTTGIFWNQNSQSHIHLPVSCKSLWTLTILWLTISLFPPDTQTPIHVFPSIMKYKIVKLIILLVILGALMKVVWGPLSCV